MFDLTEEDKQKLQKEFGEYGYSLFIFSYEHGYLDQYDSLEEYLSVYRKSKVELENKIKGCNEI